MLLRSLALLFVAALTLPSSAQTSPSTPHYLFVWAGDVAEQKTDFLSVIDAAPDSPHYGQLLTTLDTDQRTGYVHHTEYVMPEGGMLFANDHNAGRTFLFDLRDPLHPRIAGSFNDVDGYMHPHSFLRLPNQHILATFQHGHDGGGLVELDQQGKYIRSAAAEDPAQPGVFYCPYGVVPLPEIDRVLGCSPPIPPWMSVSLPAAAIRSGVSPISNCSIPVCCSRAPNSPGIPIRRSRVALPMALSLFRLCPVVSNT